MWGRRNDLDALIDLVARGYTRSNGQYVEPLQDRIEIAKGEIKVLQTARAELISEIAKLKLVVAEVVDHVYKDNK